MNKILQGSSLEVLKTLDEKSIDMCMTSPPYWALRDYGTASWEGGDENCDHTKKSNWNEGFNERSGNASGSRKQEGNRSFYKEICKRCDAKRIDKQLGLEPTFNEYISDLCDIFDGVKRVLKDEGTCWVNLGDTYSGSSSYSDEGRSGYNPKDGNTKEWLDPKLPARKRGREQVDMRNIQDKSLVMIPFRFAIEMVNRGWILRNTIIWHKNSCMPSSVKDRFTVDFEYLFFFSKKKKYYFEQQLEKTITKDRLVRDRDTTRLNNTPGRSRMAGLKTNNYDYKNKRTTWTINPKPFSEAHFAVYPEELCQTPIKAGCPEFVCVKCGIPKIRVGKVIGKRVTESMKIAGCDNEGNYYGKEKKDYKSAKANKPSETKKRILESMSQVKEYSYKKQCNCKAEFTSGIVLDPFFGAGTTGLVALKQGKKFLGIELNLEYIKIAEKRLKPYIEQKKLFGSLLPSKELDK